MDNFRFHDAGKFYIGVLPVKYLDPLVRLEKLKVDDFGRSLLTYAFPKTTFSFAECMYDVYSSKIFLPYYENFIDEHYFIWAWVREICHMVGDRLKQIPNSFSNRSVLIEEISALLAQLKVCRHLDLPQEVEDHWGRVFKSHISSLCEYELRWRDEYVELCQENASSRYDFLLRRV